MCQVNIVTVVQTGLWRTEHAHADTVKLYNRVNMTNNFHQRRALQLCWGISRQIHLEKVKTILENFVIVGNALKIIGLLVPVPILSPKSTDPLLDLGFTYC